MHAIDEYSRNALFSSVYHRANEATDFLASVGCLKDQQDVRGVAPIHVAARNGDEKSLAILVNGGANVTIVAEGGRCVLLALCEGSGDEHGMSDARMVIMNKLLEAGADPNGSLEAPCRPAQALLLHSDCPDAIRRLLVGGASVDATDINGNTALHYAAAAGRHESMKVLVEADANFELMNTSGKIPLHVAVEAGDLKAVEVMSASHNFPKCTSKPDKAGHTPLHLAVMHDKSEIVKKLVAAKSVRDARDLRGRTPVYLAAFGGRLQCVEELLAANAVLTMKDNQGRGPLHVAAYARRVDCIEAMAKREPKLLMAKDLVGMTPLHIAAVRGDADCCAVMLAAATDPNELLQERDDEGRMGIHLASSHGHAECLERLLESDKSGHANSTMNNGRTPLHLAALSGAPECVAVLLDHGVAIDAVDPDGKTALWLAASNGDPDCVALLLDEGANTAKVDFKGRSAVYIAAAHGHVQTLSLLAAHKEGLLDTRDHHGVTPLHISASKGHAQCCLFLLQNGLNAHAGDDKGRTALHAAAYAGETLCGITIIRMGGSADMLDKQDRTPVTAAVASGHRECARSLEEEARRVVVG